MAIRRNTPLAKTRPIVDENGIPNQEFRSWGTQVDNQATITGEGSPEGIVEAPVTQRYMDTLGTAGSILYIKRDSDIAGDKTKGWILV